MTFTFFLIPLFVLFLEQKYPAGSRAGWQDYLTSFSIMAIAILVLFSLGINAAAAAAGTWVVHQMDWQFLSIDIREISLGIDWLDQTVQKILTVLLVLFVHDAWLYLSHRCEHRFPALWAFHKVHHSEERMNFLTAGRDHFLQSIWRTFFSFLTIGLFIDIEFKQAAVTAGYAHSGLLLWSMFYHSNTRVELPWLDRVLVTPQVHRIHHSRLPEHQDKNFADIFPVFDIVGGTYWAPRAGEFPETGLSSGERHRNLWQAEYAPFASWWMMLVKRPPGDRGRTSRQPFVE